MSYWLTKQSNRLCLKGECINLLLRPMTCIQHSHLFVSLIRTLNIGMEQKQTNHQHLINYSITQQIQTMGNVIRPELLLVDYLTDTHQTFINKPVVRSCAPGQMYNIISQCNNTFKTGEPQNTKSDQRTYQGAILYKKPFGFWTIMTKKWLIKFLT